MTLRRLTILLAVTIALGSSAAFAATLSVGSWHVWAGSQTLTKATCTVSGAASTTDTYVDQSSPTSSFGSATTMTIIPDVYSSAKWAFVRFDISGCNIPSTGGADSAQLKLVIPTTPKSPRTFTIAPVLSSWSGTLTWNQAQSLGYGAATTTVATGTTDGATLTATVTVDVDRLIKSGTANYGWRVSDGGAAGQNAAKDTSVLSSAQAASGVPQLVINYEK